MRQTTCRQANLPLGSRVKVQDLALQGVSIDSELHASHRMTENLVDIRTSVLNSSDSRSRSTQYQSSVLL